MWQARVFSIKERELRAELHSREAEWRAREERWREREAQFTDRLLEQAKVKPVGARVEQAKVVTLPDPEVMPETWIDEAFRQDEIKEMLEVEHPDLADLTAEQIRAHHGAVWARFERLYAETHTPLRIG